MSIPMPDLTPDSPPSEDHPQPGHPWARLVLVMAVPVLLLLIGISLTR